MKNKKTRILFVVFCLIIGLVFGGIFVYKQYAPKKIAILYIATGRYIFFWDKFYKSMEKNFLPKHKKHYFIWTDDKIISFPENVTPIYIKHIGFPDITLKRFHFFSEIENKLKKFDYIYFLNANAEVVRPVGEEIFPTKEQGIMVAWHFGYKHSEVKNYPYDRNPKSTAYIPVGQGKMYVQGSFNGGRSRDYLKLIQTCKQNIQTDIDNGQMALWHDESHLNKYILDKNPLVMDINYNFYSQYLPNKEARIVIRDKNLLIGVSFFREKNSLMDKKITERKFCKGFLGVEELFVLKSENRGNKR